MDAAVFAIHQITLKSIHPALKKGPAYKAECVLQFLAAQSRAHGAIEANRNQPLRNSSVPAVCDLHNCTVPLRPAAGVPPAPLLPLNACPSGTCHLHE